MAWNPPTTSNTPQTKVTITTFDEIAENQVYLKERADYVDSDLSTGSTPNFENITLSGMTGTVEGRIETNTSDIDTLEGKVGQSLNTTNGVTFATVNTGQGANELYDMDQNVKTTSDVTFNSINTDNVALKTKVLSFTSTGGYEATVAHGLDSTKIRDIGGVSTVPSRSILSNDEDWEGSVTFSTTSVTVKRSYVGGGFPADPTGTKTYIVVAYEA